MRHWLAVPLLECARLAVGWLPHGPLLALGRLLGRAAWLFSIRRRGVARRQLEQAGVGRDDGERGAIVRRMFANLGMNAMEFLAVPGWSDERFLACVRFDDEDRLRQALSGGAGLIFATGHIGSWELMPRAVHLRYGVELTIPMAAQRDERLNEWLKRRRERPGIRIVDSDEGTFALMRHLRRGGCMGVIADQDSTRVSGIFVDFFGRPAYTPIGPARLAQSCKVGVLPLSIERDVDDPRVHRLVLGEPILPDAEAGAEAESQRMTQAYTRHLEERIRARPELWVWLHKRWRHRPGEPIRVRRRGGRKSSR